VIIFEIRVRVAGELQQEEKAGALKENGLEGKRIRRIGLIAVLVIFVVMDFFGNHNVKKGHGYR
jgi:hypothetical protein